MRLPEYLHSFQSQAEEYLAKGLVKSVEFSGSTYQVLVIDADSQAEAWTFLQLDPQGQIGDCFCDFEEAEDFTPCVHLCAAYLRLYNGHEKPLHLRFEHSLWNCLSLLFFERLGDEATIFQKLDKGHYVHKSAGRGKVIFEAKSKSAKGASMLKSLLEKRPEPTQETSLKFSNLTVEELLQWEEGRPSQQLRYELSFWNDLAKWMMLEQDGDQPYRINYTYSSRGLPDSIEIAFADIQFYFYLSQANLPLIIPALNSVKSLLKVYQAPEEEIQKITYDKIRQELVIVPSAVQSPLVEDSRQKRTNEGIPIDRWIFVPCDGFYAKEPHKLLKLGKIASAQIGPILQEFSPLIAKLLEGTALYSELVAVSYSLAFDAHWNLHISTYLFSPGDLSSGHVAFFGDWAYLDDDGFYRLKDVLFPAVDTVIAAADIPQFIAQNRTWLNMQEGFHIHVASISSQLNYAVGADHALTFSRALATKEESEQSRDFGPWVYISGQGFYAKESTPIGGSLQSDITLRPGQVPLFIKFNYDELQLIPHFFAKESPVENSCLDVAYNSDDDVITVTPHYENSLRYRDKEVVFYDDYTFVFGEGFCEIAPDKRLPERYKHQHIVEEDERELFLTQELAILKPFLNQVDKRLCQPEQLKLIATQISRPSQSEHSCLAKLYYCSEFGTMPITTLWTAIKSKARFCFSEAGLIDLDDKRFQWIRWLHKRQIDRRKHQVQLSVIELIRLHLIEEIEFKGKTADEKQAAELLNGLMQFRTPNPPDLQGFTSQLRAYQVLGVQWLWFLHCNALSGLLCDDMGLGKTHQTMALMASIRSEHAKQAGVKDHFLVVCPTSVLYHWQEKLQAYLPGVRVMLFTGQGRSLEGFAANYDLLLTSYGILRNESAALSAMNFSLAVFDEVQVAKNHHSRTYAALHSLKANMRLGLTGTPIENYLRELKALFDLVIPHYMPNETDFRELFVKPIEKEGSSERKKLLSKIIRPFVMRRKKDDVLNDLPDKIEEISHCDLTIEQRELYNSVLQAGRSYILAELSDENHAVPYIHIFALLSSLKQICNHPAVYLKCPEKYKKYSSGKWELFLELLAEARDSRQKVVVYSQYLSMLDIIEEYLNEHGIGYASIRGATVNRREQLQRFQHDPACEVFVGSLHAAGLGIDLTAASVVIHYDRWWNAARENQATDRVHRIGQTKGVQVFKLVTKHSFEEQIDELITKKAKLMEDVVGVDDHEIIKLFTREELLAFLQESNPSSL